MLCVVFDDGVDQPHGGLAAIDDRDAMELHRRHPSVVIAFRSGSTISAPRAAGNITVR